MDVGTSGLDLAYEVMRGYSALVIVDVSRQGGEPGTLYVMDVESEDVPAEIEDGETIDPHAMDPMTMLRFVRGDRRLAGQGAGRSPASRRRRGRRARARRRRSRRRSSARSSSCSRRSRSCAPTRPTRRRESVMHELSVSSAIVDTVVRHAEGRRVTAVRVRLGRLRQVVPDSLAFYFELVARDTVCEGARLEQEVVPAVAALRRVRAQLGGRAAVLPLPGLRRRRRRGRSRRGVRGRVHRGRGGRRMHRVKVQCRRGRARRQRDDRGGEPRRLRPRRRHRGQPDERARGGQDDGARARARATWATCASACSRATCRAASTPTGSRRCTCR